MSKRDGAATAPGWPLASWPPLGWPPIGWAPAAVAGLVLLAVAGCGRVVPHGGVPAPAQTAASSSAKSARPRVVDGSDLIPADLDLGLRVDLAEIRSSLGPKAASKLTAEAFDQARLKGIVRDALREADLVWLALRVSDWEAGDRVLAIQRTRGAKPLKPDPIAWTRFATQVDKVVRFEAKTAPGRGGIGEVLTVGEREAVFVSPVEQLSVRRVLRRGPDARRGQPAARGLVSMDYRVGRAGPAFEKNYPHLAPLLAGIVRVSATVELNSAQLALEGRIRCRNEHAALKVARFLESYEEAASRRFGLLKVNQAQQVVRMRMLVHRSRLVDLLMRKNPAPKPPIPNEAPPERKPN